MICFLCKSEFDAVRCTARFCSSACRQAHHRQQAPNDAESAPEETAQPSRKFGEGFIYKITNKKTKLCYVGQTKNNVTDRWWQHLRHTFAGKFGQALSEHKITDWTFEVLFIASDAAHLNELEAEAILRHDSVNNGYNTVLNRKSLPPCECAACTEARK